MSWVLYPRQVKMRKPILNCTNYVQPKKKDSFFEDVIKAFDLCRNNTDNVDFNCMQNYRELKRWLNTSSLETTKLLWFFHKTPANQNRFAASMCFCLQTIHNKETENNQEKIMRSPSYDNTFLRDKINLNQFTSIHV